jgi:hypothetical protein
VSYLILRINIFIFIPIVLRLGSSIISRLGGGTKRAGDEDEDKDNEGEERITGAKKP